MRPAFHEWWVTMLINVSNGGPRSVPRYWNNGHRGQDIMDLVAEKNKTPTRLVFLLAGMATRGIITLEQAREFHINKSKRDAWLATYRLAEET